MLIDKWFKRLCNGWRYGKTYHTDGSYHYCWHKVTTSGVYSSIPYDGSSLLNRLKRKYLNDS